VDPEETPERIGRYAVIERLGKGGFGTVYLAEQAEPVRRKVAVKVINPGMDSREVLARFEAERETLNLMNHPGIARLLDAGATDRGLPYFVMEYVPGLPLPEYARQRNLSLPARLELFGQVCEAAQHAHQKGVIHRDLSSNNVLVTEVDGKPMPKIIDFGIAKSLTQRLTDKTLHTLEGQTIGTPEFMSPEQAQGRGDQIDTRTDIYALGVQLYQLLTGTLPFPGLRQGGSLMMEKVLAEQDAEPPSSRVAKTAVQSEAHRVQTRKLARALRGELDWITAKAMAKERERRYASAAGLAADVQRYLAGEAVAAGPPSASYRLRKLLRRHRGKVAAAAAVLVALIAGLIASLLLYVRAEDNARRARANEQRAKEQEALAKAHLANFDRLADLVRLEAMEREAGELGPELPDTIPVFQAWLERADALAATLRNHREALGELRGRKGGVRVAEEGDAWRFRDHADQFLHDALRDLVAGLARFADGEDGARHRVRGSLQWAATLRARTIEGFAAEWQRAAEAVAADARFAHTLREPLRPQLGLVPLGADPDSRLQEFALLRSGSVPARGESGRLALVEDSAIVLVLLPGGKFAMGSQSADAKGRNFDPQSYERERPVDEVELAPFLVGKHEVTQAQWRALTGRTPSTYSPERAGYGKNFTHRHPVESVSWLEAMRGLAFAGLTLPTEAQWEYACRAGTSTVWWCGSELEALGDVANVADQAAIRRGFTWPDLRSDLPIDDGHAFHAPVGTYRANAFGLHETHGNVFEWCRDWFLPAAYALPTQAGDGERIIDERAADSRVLRGGGYYSAATFARAAYRWRAVPHAQSDDSGLRAARALDR
jgi:serine/threonine protein kinase/formylglycine-generating enzyme required for sulfatase activity